MMEAWASPNLVHCFFATINSKINTFQPSVHKKFIEVIEKKIDLTFQHFKFVKLKGQL